MVFSVAANIFYLCRNEFSESILQSRLLGRSRDELCAERRADWRDLAYTEWLTEQILPPATISSHLSQCETQRCCHGGERKTAASTAVSATISVIVGDESGRLAREEPKDNVSSTTGDCFAAACCHHHLLHHALVDEMRRGNSEHKA